MADHASFALLEYAGLLGNACPAAVYEYADAEGGAEDARGKKFVINSQNCIHVSGIKWRGHSRLAYRDFRAVQDMFHQNTHAGYHMDRSRGWRWSQVQ